MSKGSNTSLLYPIILCRVKRHETVMDAELLVQRIANKLSPEAIRQIFEEQVLAKVHRAEKSPDA